MFELPDAKRVRREDLYGSSSDRYSSPEREHEVDAELRAKLNAHLSSLLSLNLDPTAPEPAGNDAPSQPAEGNEDDADGEAAFDFRLFSTSSAAAPKVVLAPEEEEKPFTGPAISQRPASYYIRGELSPREREQFQYAAVTGRDVLAWAGQRAWGLEVPWRVTRITVTMGGKQHGGQQQQGSREGVRGVDGKKKKTRPGKKTRIVFRKREKVRKEKEAAMEKMKMSKEEHLKEKKKRLNREKKLKRRQKEKEKKMAAKGGAAGGGEGAGSESEGSDGEE